MDRGLLVARVYVLGMQGIEQASVDIDGTMVSSQMVDGYVAVPLEPGDHTLRRLRANGHLLGERIVEAPAPIRLAGGYRGPTFIYVPGTPMMVNYTTLSVDRPFHIEPGRVTNLGLIVYVPVPDPPGTKRAANNDSRSYNVAVLDNGVETRAFLETNYPALMGSLPSKDILLAPGKYLDPARLPALRRVIAAQEAKGPRVVYSEHRALIYGRAGTIVALTETAGGGDPKVEILDTGTLADVMGGVRHGERYTFVTSDARLITWDDGKLSQAPLPSPGQPLGIYKVGARGVMVIDTRLRLLTAPAPGEPWTSFQGLMVKTPRTDVSVAPDGTGAYLATGQTGMPANLHYLPEGQSTPQPLPAPVDDPDRPVAGPFYMFARPAGLFVVFYGSQNFLFRSRSTGGWAVHAKPEKNCEALQVDADGATVKLECGGVTYVSRNSGASWRRPET